MAKYMFLQYVDEAAAPVMGTPEKDAEIAAYGKLLEDLQAAGKIRGGDACDSSAKGFSVQVRDGGTKTTDGPMYKESPWLNGYFVIDCADRAEAISWAARIPASHGTGTVEVHPIYEFEM
jgi:hypothetical protein